MAMGKIYIGQKFIKGVWKKKSFVTALLDDPKVEKGFTDR